MSPQQEMMSDAIANGDVEGVKELIPVSDPKADDSIPLQLAAWGGNAECVRLLVPVSDPETVREKLTEGSLFNALVLFDSIHQEQILKAKHAGLSEAKARIPL